MTKGSWDSFESEAASPAKAPGPKCRVALTFADLSDEAVASINRTLANSRLTTSSIHKALSARLPAEDCPSIQSLVRHRRGDCACPRGAS